MELVTSIYIIIVALFAAYGIAQLVKAYKKPKKELRHWLTKEQLIAAVHFQMQEVTGDANLKEAEKVVERLLKYLPKEGEPSKYLQKS